MSRSKVEKNHIVAISNNILRNIENDGVENNRLTDLIENHTKSTKEDTRTIRNKELINDGKVEVNLIQGSSVWADSNPAPKENIMRRDGWSYNNPSLNDKLNLYMLDGNSENFTLGDFKYAYGKMFIDRWNFNVRNLPFFNIYTKYTGVNDAGSFYHSRITYDMSLGANTPKIGLGEECYFFAGSIPTDEEKWFSNRAIGVSNKTILGEALDDEEILFITLSTDSGADIDGVNITIQEMGFSILDTAFSSEPFKRKYILHGFINDDVVHHDNILKDFTLNIGQNTLTNPIRVDNAHGNISWWVQSAGTITSNHIGVEIQVSHDGTYYETIALNSKFVDALDGVNSRFGNIKDFKPTFVRIRITNNDNSNNGLFNVYLSY